MKNMIIRALSGAVYVGLIVASLIFSPFYFTFLMLLFAIIGVIELQKLLAGNASFGRFGKTLDILIVVLSFLILVICFDLPHGDVISAIIIPLSLYLPLRIITAVLSHEENPVRSFMTSIFSLFYVAAPLAIIVSTSFVLSTKIVLYTFIIIWLNDTGAYLTGCTFGKTKLCERLSPKKTWEGFWGGFILSAVAGGICFYLSNESLFHYKPLFEGYNSWTIICSGAVYGMFISVVGTFGDLFESLIKRRMGVKDSGNLIPGHGGILDRIDSLLAVSTLPLIFNTLFILFLY